LFVNPSLSDKHIAATRKRLLTESDLDGWFPRREVVHARELVRSGKVLKVETVHPGWLVGRVLADEQVEDQTIGVCRRGGAVYIESSCTCEEQHHCVHAAAALLSAIGQPGVEVPLSSSETEIAPTDPFLERWLSQLAEAAPTESEDLPSSQPRVLYVLKPADETRQATVEVVTAKRTKSGEWSKTAPYRFHAAIPQKIGTAKELALIKALAGNLRLLHDSSTRYVLEGPIATHLIWELLATGRCHWETIDSPALERGPDRSARLGWQTSGSGAQFLEIEGVDAPVLAMNPPVYLDLSAGVCGSIDFGIPPEAAEVLLLSPEILPEYAPRAREIIRSAIPDQIHLWPEIPDSPQVRIVQPIPVLTIGSGVVKLKDTWVRAVRGITVKWGRLEFDYGGTRVSAGGGPVRRSGPEGSILIPRQFESEAAALERLIALGWVNPEDVRGMLFEGFPPHTLALITPFGSLKEVDQEQLFFDFLGRGVPGLEKEGWQVDLVGADRPRIVRAEQFVGSMSEAGRDWFDLKLGARLEGQLLDLRFILPAVFDRILYSPEGDKGDIYVRSESGELVAVPISRLKPIVQGLVELFGRPEKWGKEFKLPIARAGEAAILSDLAQQHGGFQWATSGRLKELTKRLKAWEGITPMQPPPGFVGELRGYQQEGAGWLGFLAEFELGGILADDMGLGKTVQTLAHIVAEKERGALDRPVLVVGPTSTLPNWEAEIERFAPGLKCLKLHGPDRVPAFASIPEQDIVLTSYPLLARDGPLITNHEYHMAVLDEAQNIKNHTTKMAKTAFEIKARHRVALSGTPIENNLQELWSLFRFALPDLLGNAQEFKTEFRQPIEVEANKSAQELLIRRIRPFVLRRTKSQVASELPPKTIILDRVELEESQRDLYESVRLAMDEKVRKLFAGKGFERSRIEVLDALLKLRQVCCDPRLVKLPSAAGVTASAKLDRLIDVLTELAGEGRKVLVFSQFTSMLDLIELRLRELKIDFVRLTGQTKDRAEPVRQFQTGDVPVFLISLKAGGTGLNLTAADTVIHYDPWWNPAVENQATDRAHRIGQDKPVFVYKLVAVNTVEEKILELQEKKAELAERLLSGTADAASSLSVDDLRWLVG
jgi:hypothetical protein